MPRLFAQRVFFLHPFLFPNFPPPNPHRFDLSSLYSRVESRSRYAAFLYVPYLEPSINFFSICILFPRRALFQKCKFPISIFSEYNSPNISPFFPPSLYLVCFSLSSNSFLHWVHRRPPYSLFPLRSNFQPIPLDLPACPSLTSPFKIFWFLYVPLFRFAVAVRLSSSAFDDPHWQNTPCAATIQPFFLPFL